MSHRRSSRVRIGNQPPASGPAHSNSSSSVSSNRTERNTRSNNKQQSPRKSSTPHSLSSEDLDDQARDLLNEPPMTRRRTRGQDHEDNDSSKLEDDLDDDIRDEDEVTRCVCGYDVYPGPPTDSKTKDTKVSTTLVGSDIQSEEAEGLFVQCDNCKVWQHAGCVGFLVEEDVPEEYFCERCREDLHTIMTTSSGQTYSRFRTGADPVPPKPSTRKASISKETENKISNSREKQPRSTLETLTKRRSTMNSRAAYDEDEVLRKVLEESKTEGAVPTADSGSRKGKRSRDESEETKPEFKRQRTGSQSPVSSPTIEPEEEAPKVPKAKPRGAAARSQREREQREKEREREKAEAASKRKGRAERRRGDDADIPEEPSIIVDETKTPVDPIEPQAPDTPSAPVQTNTIKKAPRSTQKRVGRAGKNNATRETATLKNSADLPLANTKDQSPSSPHSRLNGNDSTGNGSDGPSNKIGKQKNWKLEKLSWTDIRRSASNMHTYIIQRQVELAEKNSTSTTTEEHTSTGTRESSDPKDKGENEHNEEEEEEDLTLEKFKSLSSTEMMDYLSRDLVLWQQLVGAI